MKLLPKPVRRIIHSYDQYRCLAHRISFKNCDYYIDIRLYKDEERVRGTKNRIFQLWVVQKLGKEMSPPNIISVSENPISVLRYFLSKYKVSRIEKWSMQMPASDRNIVLLTSYYKKGEGKYQDRIDGMADWEE